MEKFKEFLRFFIPFKSIKKKIGESCYDHLGKASATRISGYLTTAMIIIVVVIMMCIEVFNAFKAYNDPSITYSISVQSITVLGMLLSQQLILFNLKKKGEETSFPTLEKLKEKED